MKPEQLEGAYAALDKKLALYQEYKHILPEAVLQNYESAFRVEYTYNSTAIEGNTFSLMETKLLLEDAITPSGKHLRELYEVVNHNKAFGFVSRCIAEGKVLNAAIVKDIHTILMENIMQGGIYRNVSVYIAGAKHAPPSPDEVYQQMQCFYADMDTNRQKMHPIEYAAWTHAEFVKIHPFIDGNGRTSRLLLNYQLAAAGYLPVSIPVEQRLAYFAALETYAIEDDLLPFAAFIVQLEEARLGVYLTAIEQIRAQGNQLSLRERQDKAF